MIRVVADTNIFISALMFGGVPGSFLDLASLGTFLLVTSPVLWTNSTKSSASNSNCPPQMRT